MANTAKIKPPVVQPTSAGSNLPAQAPTPEGKELMASDAVDNIQLETEIEPNEAEQDDQQPQTKDMHQMSSAQEQDTVLRTLPQFFFTSFGIEAVNAACDGRPITDLKKLAVSQLPTKRENALVYLKAIQRLQGIMEVISSEVREAVQVRFGT